MNDTYDMDHINAAALFAAGSLVTHGHARIELTPGDMTVYPIRIVSPTSTFTRNGFTSSNHYWVCLACHFGTWGYWDGEHINELIGTYWSNGNFSYSVGPVMATFLNALSDRLIVRDTP